MIDVVAIACVNNAFSIGLNNDLLYAFKEDIEYFKQTTMNHVVIMGRGTYDSLPEHVRPLPNRVNIVITRDPSKYTGAKNLLFFNNLADAIVKAKEIAKEKQQDKVFVIGGGEIYKESMPYLSRLLLTVVKDSTKGDTFFPKIVSNDWCVTKMQKPIESRNLKELYGENLGGAFHPLYEIEFIEMKRTVYRF